MSNSSITAADLRFAPFANILHGIITPATNHEANNPELQVAGMKMIGMDFVAPKNPQVKCRQIADLLELEPMDIHYVANFNNGQPKPSLYYYLGTGDYRDIMDNQ